VKVRAIFFLVLLLWMPTAFTQTLTTGTIVGTVTDSSGGVVKDAAVSLDYAATGDHRATLTNDAGEYGFPLLKPGQYAVSAKSPGLKSAVSTIDLLVGQQQKINLVMSVEQTQQTIEITAHAALIQTENANQATAYSQKQVTDLPINGGDITNIAFSTPGLRLNVGGGNTNFNVNGLPFSSALFTMNGADITEPYNLNNKSGASNNTLGANDIAEAAVILNAYSAQYGRMAGGQVNFVTKSGANDFHGNLGFTGREHRLDAWRRQVEFLRQYLHPAGEAGSAARVAQR